MCSTFSFQRNKSGSLLFIYITSFDLIDKSPIFYDNNYKEYFLTMETKLKLFNEKQIRTSWNADEEEWYFSVVDVVAVLTESIDPPAYWRKLKQRLKDEGNETVTNCHALKLKAQDGKYRLTDVCDIEEMFRIIESIPSKNAEPIKQWLAHLGSERINETFDPSIALQRTIDLYRAKGYDENWIAKRMKSIQERKQLTDVWKENGIKEGKEYAILTNEIYKEWSGMTAGEYKQYKGLRKENLRDNMDSMELILADLSEETTKRLASKGLQENIQFAHKGGHVAKVARDEIEEQLGESIVTKDNKLSYEYMEEKQLDYQK